MPQVKTPTEEQFIQDIATHEMTIIRDDGWFRHIHCQRQGTRVYSFDILTWPGHLCVTGDMGSWLFSRLDDDMFEFFRKAADDKRTLPINPDYWSEKLLAVDCHGRHDSGATEYDSSVFAERIEEKARDYCLSGTSFNDFMRAIDEEVLSHADNGESLAMEAALNFHFDDTQVFPEFWEVNCRSYRHRFIWCLYAIVWTIQQYDTDKERLNKSVPQLTDCLPSYTVTVQERR